MDLLKAFSQDSFNTLQKRKYSSQENAKANFKYHIMSKTLQFKPKSKDGALHESCEQVGNIF